MTTGHGVIAERHPRQVEGLEISSAADGFVVFDPDRDRVHYLNHTAILILELCDGENSVADIAGFLRDSYALPTPPLDEVRECVDNFVREGLAA